MAAVVLGLLVFGFISLTLSNAGSFLVAAMQTLAIDVVKRKEVAKFDNETLYGPDKQMIEQDILSWVKQNVMTASLVSVLLFASLYYGLTYFESAANVFQFQFVMYGAAVTLVPVVITHLFIDRENASIRSRPEGFWSIAIGLSAAIIPFILAAFFWNASPVMRLRAMSPIELASDMIINLTPLFGLTASVIVFFAIRLARGR